VIADAVETVAEAADAEALAVNRKTTVPIGHSVHRWMPRAATSARQVSSGRAASLPRDRFLDVSSGRCYHG
jgi:hypothetical protein